MKEMSHILQNKYKWFVNIIDFDRKTYFTRAISCRNNPSYHYLFQLVYTEEDDVLDPNNDVFIYRFEFNEFFLFMQYIQSMQYSMMTYWNQYNQNIKRIMKTFESTREVLRMKAYRKLINEYFCDDITGVIISFLFD